MKMKKADVAVAIYIMAAIIMFIVPIPSWLLDILLAINISVALTILFATMFSKEVLDMSFFPTMLLFTTIFRIALNTSSTRLILRDGNAGNVVETFGEFVGGGDLVIGVIIFIILRKHADQCTDLSKDLLFCSDAVNKSCLLALELCGS